MKVKHLVFGINLIFTAISPWTIKPQADLLGVISAISVVVTIVFIAAWVIENFDKRIF